MNESAPGIRPHFPRWLGKSPWWLLSISLNAAILLATVLVLSVGPADDGGGSVVLGTQAMEDQPLGGEVRPDLAAARPPVEQPERALEDPVIEDAKVSDHNETDNDLPFEESLGQKDFVSDAPFEGPSTNAAIGIGGGAGIRLAYSLAREHFVEGGINRVILATDGDFNVGTTSRSALVELIESERESGVFLTVLGVGRGNVQDSQMEMLADKGNGNYAYLDTIREARKVLVEEVGGTLVTIAKDVKIQVEFNPARVGGYRLVGYENRKLAARDFNDDKKDAGEIGAGHSVTALYELLPAGERPEAGEVDALKYQEPTAPAEAWSSNEVLTLKLRYKQPDGDTSELVTIPLTDPGNVSVTATSRDFQFAAAVATFGLALRNSSYRGEASFPLAEELAHATLGDDPEGRRREFTELCRTAEALTTGR